MEPYEEDIVRQSAGVKDPRRRFWLKVIGIAFVASLVVGGLAAAATILTYRSAAQDGTELAQQIQQACSSPGLTDPDLAQFCPRADEIVQSAPEQVKSDPIPGPPGPQGSTGPSGADGADAPAPSALQVAEAVRSFCTDTGNCRGPAGQDGANATAGQVAIAVSTYCNDQGQCRGPAGTDGTDGTNGRDAAPVTQSQIIAAVDTYCTSNNNCRGPAGQDGEDGTDGQNGSDSNVPGPPGVTGVKDECGPAPDGQVINDIIPSYNAVDQIIVVNCTFKDDLQGLIP